VVCALFESGFLFDSKLIKKNMIALQSSKQGDNGNNDYSTSHLEFGQG